MTGPLPTGDDELPDPDAWGVGRGYWDVSGQWRTVPDKTVRAVLAAMGASAEVRRPPEVAPLITVDQFGPRPQLAPGQLALEGGGTIDIGTETDQPHELPLGYHRLERADGLGPVTVAVCPSACPSPPAGRTWGWSVQLYAARSRASWGIGDFADLGRLIEWAGDNGAGFVLVNPLHAPAPGPVPEPSPYFPSSRCFFNPLYLHIEDLPGAVDLPSLAALGEKARSLNTERLLDRPTVWAYKSEALEALFENFERGDGDEAFEGFIRERGQVLDGYTSFCALAEVHSLPWDQWPEEFRRPDSPAVAEFGASPGGRTRKRYHAWLQWQCEAQLARADHSRSGGRGAGIMCDLAVGVDGCGADAWMWQDTFALGMRVGAPPDEFNTSGQDWGLAPWDPWKLQAAGYRPYIEMLRAVLRPARGVRVDHVMGLFRLFWVPLGETPTEGAYVYYIWQDMVGLLRLEATRAGTYVVGEDLGTVEDYVREILAGGWVMSYRLLWFEPERPPGWPVAALAAVTTHDLPTVAGVWTGFDVEAQRRIGLRVNEDGCATMRRRLAEWTSSADDRPLSEVIEATYAALSTAPSALLVAVLDDAAQVRERPNMPGTIDEWPNWCLALPVPLEEIQESDLAAAIARHLDGG